MGYHVEIPFPAGGEWYSPRLSTIARYIQPGDLLLFSGIGVWSTLIQREGRCRYSHAAMADRDGDRLLLLESREFKGVRCIDLAAEIARRPAQCTWRPVDYQRFPEAKGSKAAEAMWALTGMEYGRWNVIRAGLGRTRGLRLLFPPVTDDNAASKYPPYCSDAVNRSWQQQGIDPVKSLASHSTEPCDLLRSALWRDGAVGILPG